MAAPLKWAEGEGYDIHLLPGGPASKKLVDALDLESSQKASVAFIPDLLGSVDQHGVSLEANTGVVTALTQIDPSFPKVNNFLLSATFPDPTDPNGRQTARLNNNAPGKMQYEVLNGGTIGGSLSDYYYSLSQKAELLQPDMILVGLALNDILVYPEELYLRNAMIPADPSHPSVKGNQIAADEIFRVLKPSLIDSISTRTAVRTRNSESVPGERGREFPVTR